MSTLDEFIEKYSQAYDILPDSVLITDTSFNIFYVNSAFEQLFGYSLQDVFGRKPKRSNGEKLTSDMQSDNLNQVLEGGVYHGTFRYQKKDNSEFYCEMSISRLVDESGNIMGYLGVHKDITDLVDTYIDLDKNLNLMQGLIDTIPLPIFYKGVDGRYMGANKAWLQDVIGKNIDEVIGKTPLELSDSLTPELAKRYVKKDEELFADHQLQIYESDVVYADGSTHHVQFHKAVWFDQKGSPEGIIGVVLDLTEQNKQEEKRKALEAQLNHSSKLEAVGTLVGGIAHEFNNILSIILGSSELLKDDILEGDPNYEVVQDIYHSGKRARDIVKQLLTFSRSDETKKEVIDLSSCVNQCMKVLHKTIPSSINVRYSADSDIFVEGSDSEINQILMNLVTNSSHAMPVQGGIIEVKLEKRLLSGNENIPLPPGEYAYLGVQDNGYGIPKENIDSIFNPFFTTKEVGKGTGMGLSVVHGLVNNNKGYIGVESTPMLGTTFNIYLPLKERSFDKQKKDRTYHGKGENIIFVDDEPQIVKLYERKLSKLGYNTFSFTDSQEALDFFNSNPTFPDLIISDMAMPNMDGFIMISHMRKKRPDLKTILCTGYSDRISEQDARKSGVSAYLNKPVTANDIAMYIRKVLEEK